MASAVFTVEDISPIRDPLWPIAGEAVHRDFWRAVVAFTLEVKDESLSKGLDRTGSPMVPISDYTRKHRKSAMGEADPSAPPLTPAYGLSRTRAFLKGRAFATHAQFFWGGGWGRILDFHRRGAFNRRSGRNLPKRDVIGLSYKDLVKVEKLALGWWANWKKGKITEPVRKLQFQPPDAKKVQPAPFKKAVVQPPPRKIKVVGDTNYENYTFGIGSGPGSGIERARAALAAGYATGFREFRAPRRGTGGGAILPRQAPNRPKLKRSAARKAN